MADADESDVPNPLSPSPVALGQDPGHHIRRPPRDPLDGASDHIDLPPGPLGQNPGHHIIPPFEDLAGVFKEHTAAMDRLTDALQKSSFSEDIAARLAALEKKSGGTA